MQPQQPSDDPNQGGQYPSDRASGGQQPGTPPTDDQYSSAGQYAPGPESHGGHPPYAFGASGTARAKMPGSAIAVRVLMFIGGVCGLLLGGMTWLIAGLAAGGGQAGEEVRRAMEQTGMPMSGAEAGAFLGLIGVIPFVYGVISILLASLMGRRSPAVLWSVVVFQALAALLLLVNIFSGALAGIIPLVFAIVMIVLMLLEGTRAHYSRSSEDFRAH